MQSLRSGVKTGHGPYRRWRGSKDGKQRQYHAYTKEETWVEFSYQNVLYGQKDMGEDGPALSALKKIAEGVWRAMGWACDEKTECGD